MTKTNTRLKVGDTVQFTCEGHDAQGRALSWHLRVNGELMSQDDGEVAQLRWTARQDHIAASTHVVIYVTCDAYYHAVNQNDAVVTFVYVLRP